MKPSHIIPLPSRAGVNPSLVWLPVGQWPTILAFLTERFPNVDTEIWLSRMHRGEVVTGNGEHIHANSHYQAGMCLYYYREIPNEVPIPFQENVLYETKHILVVDKPHFLPVTPSGGYLQETLLLRLRNAYHNPDIAPIHRLDRETAGIILFSKNRASRGAYQQLFANRQIHKVYHALAPTNLHLSFPLTHRSRMVEADPFFIMRETAGVTNSETRISVLEQGNHISLYQLEPLTGKKHQLRVHMAGLGMPIINDSFYPTVQLKQRNDYDNPLKLLAKKIAFIDPVNQEKLTFESQLSLS